jgi:hypothetical protein
MKFNGLSNFQGGKTAIHRKKFNDSRVRLKKWCTVGISNVAVGSGGLPEI